MFRGRELGERKLAPLTKTYLPAFSENTGTAMDVRTLRIELYYNEKKNSSFCFLLVCFQNAFLKTRKCKRLKNFPLEIQKLVTSIC